MSNTFLCSDLHLSHRNIVNFLRTDGSKVRPWNTTEEMDEALISNWNSVVGDKDKVIVLGDVVINRKALPLCARLNGIKYLVKGNHDVFRLEEYTPYFKDIYGAKEYDKAILTHIPVHPQQLERYKFNVHGHLHTERVMRENTVWDEFETHVLDERYVSVCMEQINYTPFSWD
jgi:calcineurin-like phosphoesterase family protein